MSVAYFTPDEQLIYYCRKNGTTYLGPEKKKPYIFRQIAMVLVPLSLALGIHLYFKEKREAEKKQALAQKQLQVEIKEKAMKRRLMKKMTRMEKDGERI